MADLKVTALSELAIVAREDLLHMIDDPTGTPINVKSTIGDMMNDLMSPVSLADSNVTLTEATHAGRLLIGNNLTADRTLTLPTPKLGMTFRIVGPNVASAAEDNFDLLIACGTGNSVFFQGQVTFLDIDGNEVSVVGSDGDSNELFQINVPGHYDITLVGVSTSVYRISGFVTSDTAPTFAD